MQSDERSFTSQPYQAKDLSVNFPLGGSFVFEFSPADNAMIWTVL